MNIYNKLTDRQKKIWVGICEQKKQNLSALGKWAQAGRDVQKLQHERWVNDPADKYNYIGRLESRLYKLFASRNIFGQHGHFKILPGEHLCCEQRYASKCKKWGEYNPYTNIYIGLKTILTSRVISGVRTYSVGGKTCWIERLPNNAHGYIEREGFVIDGYHIAAKTETEARNILAAKLQKIRHDKMIRREKSRARYAARKGKKLVKWVTVRDSRSAGNCVPGTEDFIMRHNLESWGAIRSDYLLQLEDSNFTRRAVLASTREFWAAV